MRRHVGYLVALAVLVTTGTASAAWVVTGAGTAKGSAVNLPAQPQNVTVNVSNCTLLDLTATVSWAAVENATEYEVVRTTAGVATTGRTTATSVTDVLPLGSLTSYTVQAIRHSWTGPRSNPVSVPTTC